VVVNKYLNWLQNCQEWKKEESSISIWFYSMFCWTCYLSGLLQNWSGYSIFYTGFYFVIRTRIEIMKLWWRQLI
jgi:hypothetical protein